MRSRFQMGRSWLVFDFKAGPRPPAPSSPWHTTQPWSVKTFAPSLGVPRPGGSSSPVEPMLISLARISSADGVRPKPYVGADCANAELTRTGLPRSNRVAASLSEPIGHLPVLSDPPRHDAIVEPRHVPNRLLKEFGDLLQHRLLLPDLVGAARKKLGLVSIPIP